MSVRCQRRKLACLFDHLVSNGEHARRNGEAKRLRGLEIYNQFELSRLLNWQVRWLRPAQNFVDIFGGVPEQVRKARSIGHQTAHSYVLPRTENRRKPRSLHRSDDQ